MVSKRGEDGDLSLIYWPSVGFEINGLTKYMKARQDTQFLVLVPRRFIGYYLKSAIGGDAQTSFHEEVLEIPLVQERFALASYIANPEDSVALRTLLGFKGNGIEYGQKRNAQAYKSIKNVKMKNQQLIVAITKGELDVKGQGAKHLITRANETIETLKIVGKCNSIREILEIVFDPTLSETLDDDRQEKAKQDLEQIRDAACIIMDKVEDISLPEILDLLRYRIAMRIPLKEQLDARIKIMTLHGAKGLEADVVIVAGVADQLIPGIESRDPVEAEQIREEQRRLLYVSITRAKQELVISWPSVMQYKEARKNNARIDNVWRRPDATQMVTLSKTRFLPDIPQRPQTGKSWLKEKIGE